MNLKNLISILDLNKVDKDELANMAGRRGFIKMAKDFSLKTALLSVPFALTTMPRIVHAQTSSVTDVLNFALTLEYLEDEFYRTALTSANLIPASDAPIFQQISKHETAHVNFLKTALGTAAVTKPTFDFTAGGMFANVFSSYPTFLTISQAFEDTGVRAYKGQAGNLMNSDATLTQALQIHSVEARHAAEVRWLRGKVSGQAIKPWIELKKSDGAPQAIYDGEDNTTHAKIDINSINSLAQMSAEAKTRAFDEPLTKEQVMAIVGPFIS